MLSGDNSFIDHFFDSCFYRYRNEIISQGSINLKRLFFEILSWMLKSMRNRVMSEEEFNEISRMIEILFANGIMLYTDPNRFVYDFGRLQGTMNEALRVSSVSAMNNRLFTLMKDKAIQFHGIRKRIVSGGYSTGLSNTAMYLYRRPIAYDEGDAVSLPQTMQLRCVLRNGELFVIPPDRAECPVSELYLRDELPVEKLGYVSYPLFCGRYLFGMLVCGADGRLFEIGEFLTFQLSRAIYMNWVTQP